VPPLLLPPPPPGRPVDDYNRLLHVVIVGGGPTGVEVAGELSNLINRDLKHIYPDRAKAMRWVAHNTSLAPAAVFDGLWLWLRVSADANRELSNLINRDLRHIYPDRAKAMRWAYRRCTVGCS
jgi:hypothetical protein